jgi:hypothetical protein
VIQTKHSIKVRLPTPSPAQPSTPKRAPGAEPLVIQEFPKASTKHAKVAEPIYYIPHPDEFAAREASFPHTTYVITKGEEVGLFSAWYVPRTTHRHASDMLYQARRGHSSSKHSHLEGPHSIYFAKLPHLPSSLRRVQTCLRYLYP